MEKEISQVVIRRLPRYFRYLEELKEAGVERISSQELSRIMDVTASQIRQDFNNFGEFGQQGYGYNIEYLYNEIAQILGVNTPHSMILIGAGNLGGAIAAFINTSRLPYRVLGAFDIDSSLFGKTVGSALIHPMEEMPQFISDNHVDSAVLAVPRPAAVQIAQTLTACGIRAIWNFAHVDLPVPAGIPVENVHLLDSLMKLTYNLEETKGEDHV